MILDKELLKDCRRRHSLVQLDSFITIRSGMNRYGCLHQALRELHARRSALRGISKQLHVARWKALFFWPLSFVFRDTATGLRETVEEIEHDVLEIEMERDRFRAQAVALREAMERLDGVVFPLDPETIDRLERERWILTLKANAAVELMTSYPPMLSKSTVEIFRSLPRYMKDELAMVFDQNRHAELREWFLGYETPDDPLRIEGPESPTTIAVRVEPARHGYSLGVAEIQIGADTWNASA